MKTVNFRFIFLLVVAILNGCHGMKSDRIVTFRQLSGYAEYGIFPESAGIIVRSGDYWVDSFRLISSYKVEKCSAGSCYYVTYYLNNFFENKNLDILRFQNGSVEVKINIPGFNEDSAIYYKDASGVYPIKKGDAGTWEKYWTNYLKELEMKKGAYGDPHDIGINIKCKNGSTRQPTALTVPTC